MTVNASVTIVNPNHIISVVLNGAAVSGSRELPIRIFGPSAPGEYPVVVYSHGHFGGPTSGTGLQAEALASLGYIVIAPRHPDSLEYGAAIAQQFPVENPVSTLHRVADVQFALDQAVSLVAALGPGYIADMNRAVIAGHSHGAYVAALIGGLDPDWAALDPRPGNPFGLEELADPRFKAVIAVSPQGVSSAWAQLGPQSWALINRPVLTITSDADETPGADGGVDSRLDLFRYTRSPTALALFDGASHGALGGFGATSELTAQVTRVMDHFIRASLSADPTEALRSFSDLVDQNDLLRGAFDGPSGSGLLIGDNSADTFTLLQTQDNVFGGGGIDTVVIATASASASFERTGVASWQVSSSSQGVDLLEGVERVRFLDRTLALRPAEGSVDGDGTSDIILRNANGTIALWTMNGASVTGAQIVAASDPNFSALGQGDFDGDGRFDVLFRNAGGILAQWQMNGATVSAVGAYVTDPNWSVAAIGDFNGDFRDDILWRNSSGLLAQWQMNGLAASAVGVFAASDPSWSIVAAADFNGDGKDDLLWRNASGLLALWQMDGFTVASAGVIAASDPTWQIVGTGDFNGDLREDILWRSSGGVLAQWTMDGGSVLSAGAFAVSDLAWSVSDIGDYNGDGRDDILWQGPDGTFALWTLDGFAVASAGIIGNPGSGWTDIA
jgi:dienelactone hydrolase